MHERSECVSALGSAASGDAARCAGMPAAMSPAANSAPRATRQPNGMRSGHRLSCRGRIMMRSRAKPCQDRPIPRLRPSQFVRRSAILEAGPGQERASRAAEPRAKKSSCGFAERASAYPARPGKWRRCKASRSNRTAVSGRHRRPVRGRHGDDRRSRRANALQSKVRKRPDRHA